MEELFKTRNLHTLKAVGQHMLGSARDNGQDTSKPLAFVGLVTMGIGALMLVQSQKQAGRGR